MVFWSVGASSISRVLVGSFNGILFTAFVLLLVGVFSFVAAGAVVRENFVVPPRSLVAGVPAKILRPVSDEEVEAIRRSAQGYVDKVQQYL